METKEGKLRFNTLSGDRGKRGKNKNAQEYAWWHGIPD
jgi:hypothetical protein